MTFLNITNVRKAFGSYVAVEDVTFSAERGECIALLGPSGCGKTSTLRMIAGLEHPDSGEIYVDGRDVTRQPPYSRNIGIVFQDYALFPHMTIDKNIVYGMKQRKVGSAEMEKRLSWALKTVKLHGFEQRRPSQLSGGQQQRVAIARALVTHPDILLLDEPLSNLDAKLRENLRHEIRQVVEASGVTTVIVTHDQHEAMSIADRIVLMNAGKIAQIAKPQDIYERPADRFTADFVGKMNWLQSHDTDGRIEIIQQFKSTLEKFKGVDVGVRPERVVILPEHSSSSDVFTFEFDVEAVEFLGPQILIWFSIEGNVFSLVAPSDVLRGRLPAKGNRLIAGFKLADMIAVSKRI